MSINLLSFSVESLSKYSISKTEFAIILSEHNTDISFADFLDLLYQAVDSRELTPISPFYNYSTPPEERDYKFKTKDLIEWACNKKFNLPAEPNHNSQTKTSSLPSTSSTTNQDILNERQKEIGSKGGKRPKAKEALTLLAANELGHKRGFTDFMKILKEHSSTEPYDGIDECSDIYLDGKNMCYAENKDNKSIKTSIAIASMRRYFTNSKKNK